MDRKKFLKKTVLGATGIAATNAVSKMVNLDAEKSTYDKLKEQVGFNHLPNNEMKDSKSVLHKAVTRGGADHGWLKTKHSFSFANYRNPERMNFGVLRVLNDDIVAPGRGFNTHPHDNMEIISIPLEGDLQHKDSIGNVAVIRNGDIQVMSAGTGVYHSEFNKNEDQDVKFLQIWLFPNQMNVSPRYDQISIKDVEVDDAFYQILSPNADDAGVWIHQNAWFHMGNFSSGVSSNYELKDPHKNGVYVFVLDGDCKINDQVLSARDGFGIWDLNSFSFEAISGSKVLLMEVPMELG